MYGWEGKIIWNVAGFIFLSSPGRSWGDFWALEGVAQDVAFNDTFGIFPVRIGQQGEKGEDERCQCLSWIRLLLLPAIRVA